MQADGNESGAGSGRTAGQEFLRSRQALLWPRAASPRSEQLDRAEAISGQLRDFYRDAEYLDDDHRAATAVELEAFIERLGGPPSASAELIGPDTVVAQLATRIGQAATDLGHPPNARPVLGTAHTGTPTAMSYAVPACDVPVVLIDVSLLSWIHIVTSNLAELFETDGDRFGIHVAVSPEKIEQQLRNNPNIGVRLALATLSYATQATPTQDMLSPSVRTEGLAQILRDAVELFVVGHEIGHFLENHFDADIAHIAEADEVMYSWEQEAMADGRGLELSIRALQLEGVPPEIGVLGADLFFGLLLLADQTVDLASDGDAAIAQVISSPGEPSATHPPPGQRRRDLRALVARSDPDSGASFAPIYEVSDSLHAAALLGIGATMEAMKTLGQDS